MSVDDRLGSDARLQRYFSHPFPGDNSIYYGLFVFKAWRDSFEWSVASIGGVEHIDKFHAFDWLWMSRIIYLGPVHRPTSSFVIQRSENDWRKYHDAAHYKRSDLVNGNALLPLIKILIKAYPDIDLLERLYELFEVKARQRCAITGEKFPAEKLLRGQFLDSIHLID